MTDIKLKEPVKAILLDIEGTVTSIAFVFQTLFPYARNHVRDFLLEHQSREDVLLDVMVLAKEHQADQARGLNPPPYAEGKFQMDSTVAYVHWLMDQDRKSTPLKSVQGKIWEEGYRKGELTSDVFADVPPALRRWNEQHRQVCIYSSGSVLAQRLLFAHTSAGDLTGLIAGYFDTRTGAKQDAGSYGRIAQALQMKPVEMLFLSDVTAELDAAHAAGAQTLLAMRPGNAAQPRSELYSHIMTFDDLFPKLV